MTALGRKPKSWLTVGSLLVAVAGGGAWLGWRAQVQAIDRAIERKRSALEKLHLGGKLPPNPDVMEYLQGRSEALDAQYQSALTLMASLPPVLEEHADPQLYFQQRVHEVQRTLERLTTAHGMTTPVQLGFPKELPPADVVPRLIVQLGLIEDAAELVIVQGISQLTSVKIDDPEPVTTVGDDQEGFLMRLPVRLRLSCSLDALAKILVALDRARPVIEVGHLRLNNPPESKHLDAELVIARYLVTAPHLDQPVEEPQQAEPARTPSR